MFAGSPDITDIGALLDTVDGVVLTGARANVHPARFRTEPHARHEPYDVPRDDVALALSEVCVARGIPLFGICRGLQEMNVAFGGSLHPEIRELPGRMNHRMPRLETGEIHPDPEVVFADRHDVSLVPGGAFARLFGCETIRVNSLHGQGILEPGGRVVVEGVAEDGTIEAIRSTIPLTAPCSRRSATRYRYESTVLSVHALRISPTEAQRAYRMFLHTILMSGDVNRRNLPGPIRYGGDCAADCVQLNIQSRHEDFHSNAFIVRPPSAKYRG